MKPAWGWDIRRAEEMERGWDRREREEAEELARERGYAMFEATTYKRLIGRFEADVERRGGGRWDWCLWLVATEKGHGDRLVARGDGLTTADDAMKAANAALEQARGQSPAALEAPGSVARGAEDIEVDDGDPTGGHGD